MFNAAARDRVSPQAVQDLLELSRQKLAYLTKLCVSYGRINDGTLCICPLLE